MVKGTKIVSCILSVTLAAGLLLSGCGKQEEKKTDGAKATAAAQATAAPAAAQADSAKPVKLKWIIYGETLEESQKVWEEFNKQLSAVLPNTTVEMSPIDGPSYDDKTRLIVAAGEQYDLMWAASWKGDAKGKVAGGAFMPIKDLIEKSAPNLKNLIPAPDWLTTEFNGVLYGVPSHQTISQGKAVRIVHKHADKYKGLVDTAAIEKLKEDPKVSFVEIIKKFEPILEKAKADGFNEYPAIMAGFITEAIGKNYEVTVTAGTQNAPIAGIKFGASDYKIYNILEGQEIKDAFALGKEWAKKGYFAKDLASWLKTPNSKIGSLVTVGNGGYGSIAPSEKALQADIAAEQRLFGGTDYYDNLVTMTPPLNAGGIASSANFISKGSKNADKAIKLLEILNTPAHAKIYNTLAFGMENDFYKIKPDGNMEVLKKTYKMRDWVIANTDNSAAYASNKEVIEDRKKRMAAAPVSAILGYSFDSTNVKNEIAAVSAIIGEYWDALHFGLYSDPTAKYNEFIAKMKTAGMDKIVAEAQKQLDDWAKAKGKK